MLQKYLHRCLKSSVAMLLLCVLLIPSTFGDDPIWVDEFDGDSIDDTKWSFDTGDGCPNSCGWGNDELEWYQEGNAEVKDGILTITVKKESVGGKDYTSAKMLTKGNWKYGRVEIKAKLPKGQGVWPAIWMLPSDNVNGDWPRSGELDIMESKGQSVQTVGMTAHYGNSKEDKSQKGTEFTLPSGDFSDDFHVFSIDWKEDQVDFQIDNVTYVTVVPGDVGSYIYPFNENFYIILNVAIGGNYGGAPDDTTELPASMQVDYVKVFQ